jgi:CRP-like cAMP-binding protein
VVPELLREWLDPSHLLTHLPYALLVLSMMMSEMVWLRTIAIAAGLIRIVNRAWFDIDPIVVPWEMLFVAVNVGQLLIIWYYRKRHRFSAEEQRLVDRMPADIERRTVRKFLRLGRAGTAQPDHVLTEKDRPVAELVFVSEGIVQIEDEGRIVAVCGAGEFVGEMSFITGGAASATARVVRPITYMAFDQQRLREAMAIDTDLKRALDGILNRDLVGKLVKSNATRPVAG